MPSIIEAKFPVNRLLNSMINLAAATSFITFLRSSGGTSFKFPSKFLNGLLFCHYGMVLYISTTLAFARLSLIFMALDLISKTSSNSFIDAPS